MKKNLPLVLALLAAPLLDAGAASAGPVFDTHGLVAAQTLLGGFGGIPGNFARMVGNDTLDTGFLSDASFNGHVHYSGKAQAVAALDAGHLLGVRSRSTSDGSFTDDPFGFGQGVAAWRDVAFVHGPDHPPALRLVFHVEGSVDATEAGIAPYSRNLAHIGIAGVGDRDGARGWFESPAVDTSENDGQGRGDATAEDLRAYGTGTISAAGLWDSASFSGSGFVGTFHVDAEYDESIGGYAWAIALNAYSLNTWGTSEVDGMHSAGLQAVTLLDGTPVDVTFDSGLRLAPVPEPASFLLLGTGVISSLGYGLCRRRRRV